MFLGRWGANRCVCLPDTAVGRLVGHVATLPPRLRAKKGLPVLYHNINDTPLILHYTMIYTLIYAYLSYAVEGICKKVSAKSK